MPISNSPWPRTSKSTSAIRTILGNAVPTRTPTAYCGSTSRRESIWPMSRRPSWTPLHANSTSGHARRWTTKHQQSDIDKLLRRSVESKVESRHWHSLSQQLESLVRPSLPSIAHPIHASPHRTRKDAHTRISELPNQQHGTHSSSDLARCVSNSAHQHYALSQLSRLSRSNLIDKRRNLHSRGPCL